MGMIVHNHEKGRAGQRLGQGRTDTAEKNRAQSGVDHPHPVQEVRRTGSIQRAETDIDTPTATLADSGTGRNEEMRHLRVLPEIMPGRGGYPKRELTAPDGAEFAFLAPPA